MNDPRFSDSGAAARLTRAVVQCAAKTGSVRIMEVCGTHTMEIGRLGIRQLLPRNVELVSGPGCPVCVTPAFYIDALCGLASSGRARVAAFGDLFRVPGTTASLAKVKADGADVRIVTSPQAAVDMARGEPSREVVFTAVGFETTVPSTAAAVRTSRELGLKNISFLVAHRLVPPALAALMDDASLRINAFLLPGHVSAVTGEAAYAELTARRVPGVIAGFEPLDILAGILALTEMIAAGTPAVRNGYTRVVRPEGNPAARSLMDAFYEPCDAVWRGIGTIPRSGLALRREYAAFDAGEKFGIRPGYDAMPQGCSCGDVLKGRLRPDECPLFGRACTPESPVGPCMVSGEGSCAAFFRYGG